MCTPGVVNFEGGIDFLASQMGGGGGKQFLARKKGSKLFLARQKGVGQAFFGKLDT